MKPNICLIVLDSVRAFNCSLYGYEKRTTPFLESIAQKSVLYLNAISNASSTVPAHASLFTGTFPSTHQLFIHGTPLTSNLHTLAEILSHEGYHTYGICYQDDISPSTGLHRGFSIFDMEDDPGIFKTVFRGLLQLKAPILSVQDSLTAPTSHRSVPSRALYRFLNKMKDSTLSKALYWIATSWTDQGAVASEKKLVRFLDSIDTVRPFFLYLHYDEAHLPYRPIRPFRSEFHNEGHPSRRPWLVNQDRNKFFLNEVKMDYHDFAILRALYDGSIAYLDKMCFHIYKILSDRRFIDNTLFIVLSDHGDNIGEHELMSHKYSVHDTIIKVPFLVKYPTSFNLVGQNHELVQLTDILPTIVDILDVRDHPIVEQIEGNSLVSNNFAKRSRSHAISELAQPFGKDLFHLRHVLQKYDKSLFSIRTLTHKFIWSSDGRHEFYDLKSDPLEYCNLIDSHSDELNMLIPLVQKHRYKFDSW